MKIWEQNKNGHVWPVRMANQFKPRTRHTKNQSDPQIPSQICVSPQNDTAKQHRNGARPNKNTQLRFAMWYWNDSTVSLLETCKLIIYCGSSSNVIHVRELSASRNHLDCHASSQKIWQSRSSCIAQLVPIAILIVNVGPVMVSVVGTLSLE